MTRYRLRYLSHELELPVGDFYIGRSPECQLALDDPLVSRKHALLRVEPESVTLEDLGSRNGVVVNGQRAPQSLPLNPGDRIMVGSQELALVRAAVARFATQIDIQARTTQSQPVPFVPEETQPRRIGAFQLLFGVAEKALALGRIEEAERILTNVLSDVMSQLTRVADTESLETGARYALRLANETGNAKWIDWVFEAYGTAGRVLSGSLIDELHVLVRKNRYAAGAPLREYVSILQDIASSLGPADRFLAKRVVGLLDVAKAH